MRSRLLPAALFSTSNILKPKVKSWSALLRAGIRRKLVCFAIILSLLIWPGPGVTLRPALEATSVLASTVSSTAASVSLSIAAAVNEVRSAVMMIPLEPLVVPVPVLPIWPFQSSAAGARSLTIADRTARAVSVAVAPQKYVGYIGDSVTFVAMGADALGQPAHGVKFTWESSDERKLTIDEAGRATLMAPGMVVVTARAGAAVKTAPVLIRPTRRRVQTDAEWRADQDSLVSSAGSESGIGNVLASLGDRLMPTAHAQGGQGADYANAAQSIGTPPFAALEETRLGPVMPQTNFELPISLVDLGGRGLATSLTAYYNSNVWGAYFDPIRNGTVYVFDPIQSWPSPGFSVGFGRIVIYDPAAYYNPNNPLDTGHRFMLVAANGTRYNLGVGSDTGSNTLQTTDGSHITYVGNAMGGTVYYQDGTKMTIGLVNNRRLPTQITETNGNYIQIAYKWETNYPGIAINYIVDTLGRVINFNYGEWPAPPGSTLLTSITGPGCGATFNYQTVTMNYSFADSFGGPAPVENAPATFSAVSTITGVGRPTYNFSYSGYGMIYRVSAVSGGGTATVTYNYPLGGEQIIGGPTFTQRTETPSTPTAVYTYGTDITRPDGTKLTLSYGGGSELKNSSGQTLSKTETTLTTDPGGSTAVQSIVTTDESGQQTKTDFDYDAYGNVVNKREYGFKISGQWQVRRRTHYSYVNWEPYLSQYVRNRVWMVEVFDALQNTNDADDVLIGKTIYGYDSPLGGMEGYGGIANPPGHLSSYDTTVTTRGSLTSVTKYSDVVAGTAVTHSNKTDIFGNVTLAQVACCDQKSFTMTEATYWTKPAQITSGNTSGTYLTSSAAYDFNTLTETSATDPNNQTRTYSYDAAQRPTGFTAPSGASGVSVYNVWGQQTYSSTTWNEGGTNKTATQTSVYDAWGQMTSAVDASGAQTNYGYDNMGHRITQTNPFAQGGTPGPVTTYGYDLLGRNTLVTLPGGNTIQTSYTNSTIVTATDQVNREIKRESDGLGRLIKVTEQDVATGNLTQATNYTYDIADRLTMVNQGNQTRAFKYDAEGKLLFERIPEMTATINDGTGTFWSSRYTYTDWGAVATKQDARGVISTHVYDTLHRLVSTSYNTVSGVTTAPTVTYNFDNNQSSTTKGLLLSLTVGTGYSESYAYDTFKRVQSVTRTMDGRNYTTSYQLNTRNQLTQMTYPVSGRTLNIAHDSIGRVSSVADQYRTYINDFAYNGAGQVTGFSLGSVASENFDYDTNRMQLISQRATQTGGAANGLMNLTYGYQASGGQMGAGSTAGNVGQLMSISGTIGGVTESAAYTYDNLGRLLTSNQTSNGSSAQRRFVYDRWGNRTEMWDAVSGGNQIQLITLEQSGGAPTNRITSIGAGKGALNYVYDAAGNVTNDGVHSYAYDSENRLVTVDGGSTASYAYDQSNRRYKKTVGPTVTHYVWEGSQVLAEHNGTDGSVIFNYVYFGSRLLARMGSGQINWYVSDRLSTRLVLDASGNVIGRQGHLPFGDDFGESGTQEKHRFTSYERDSETGLDYAINREYSMAVGRFTSADPYRASGYMVDPQSWNRFGYVANDPANYVDAAGEVRYIPPILVGGPEPSRPGGAPPLRNPGGERGGSGGGGTNKPCQNVDGFTDPVNGYQPAELNDAAITVFGELSGHYNANSRAEAEAIASVIFNRSAAIANPGGPVKPDPSWGGSASLSAVVQAGGGSQFAGFSKGQEFLQSGVDLNEGDRNCNRLQTAGSAIAWMAANPSARKPYLYMCAEGHVTTPPGDDVHINHNVFSTEPLGCH